METFLAFNLGPLFKLEKLVGRMMDVFGRDFLYKVDSAGNFATKNVKDRLVGSAVLEWRKQEEDKDHFPKDFWTKDDF